MTTEGLSLEAYTLSDQANVLHQKGILTSTYPLDINTTNTNNADQAYTLSDQANVLHQRGILTSTYYSSPPPDLLLNINAANANPNSDLPVAVYLLLLCGFCDCVLLWLLFLRLLFLFYLLFCCRDCHLAGTKISADISLPSSTSGGTSGGGGGKKPPASSFSSFAAKAAALKGKGNPSILSHIYPLTYTLIHPHSRIYSHTATHKYPLIHILSYTLSYNSSHTASYTPS